MSLKMPTGDALCLVQFTRNHNRAPFSDVELHTATTIGSLLRTVAYQYQMNKTLKKQAELTDYMLDASPGLLNAMMAIDKLVETIVVFTKILVQADCCDLFLIDKEKDEHIVTSWNDGIPSLVAQTGESIDNTDAYSDGRFNKETEKKTGYTTHNIMCVPIISKSIL